MPFYYSHMNVYSIFKRIYIYTYIKTMQFFKMPQKNKNENEIKITLETTSNYTAHARYALVDRDIINIKVHHLYKGNHILSFYL